MSNEELEKKAITFDQICESQDFDHNEKFVLLLYANKEIERLKAEIESHNKKYENLYKSYCSICREKEGLKDYAVILIDKEKKENQQLKQQLEEAVEILKYVQQPKNTEEWIDCGKEVDQFLAKYRGNE